MTSRALVLWEPPGPLIFDADDDTERDDNMSRALVPWVPGPLRRNHARQQVWKYEIVVDSEGVEVEEVVVDPVTEEELARVVVDAQALGLNHCVSHVQISIHEGNNANWDDLLRVLATHRNLDYVEICDVVAYNILRRGNERLYRPFLQAIQQNSSVRRVHFSANNIVAEDLCNFLDTAEHVSELRLWWEEIDTIGGEQEDVVAALQRNQKNVETLVLGTDFPSCIVDAFVSSTFLRKLVINIGQGFSDINIGQGFSEAKNNALEGLLQSTGSIQQLELPNCKFEGESVRSIVEGFINASNVTDITLKSCRFNVEGATSLMDDIFKRKKNLRSFGIQTCEFFPLQLYPALFSVLRRRDSPLRHLHLVDIDLDTIPNRRSFNPLLRAVAKSKLESFAFGEVTHHGINALAEAIPSMKIRDLSIHFRPDEPLGYEDMKQTLREAVRNNFTLQSVKYQCGDDDPFDASEEDESMAFNLDRNRRLAESLAHPITVPILLRAEALYLASQAGPDAYFRLFREFQDEGDTAGAQAEVEEAAGDLIAAAQEERAPLGDLPLD